jgi:outer membrane protein assembly factor BamB
MNFSSCPYCTRQYPLILVILLFLISCKKDGESPEVTPLPPTPPTASVVPTVITHVASSVTYNTAIIGGDVTDAGTGIVTSRGVCYSTLPDPTVFSTKVEIGSGTGSFTTALANLQPNTIYYFKSFAYNSTGLSYGPQNTFKTLPADPLPQSGDFAETIYIGNANSFCAFNAQTGALKWKQTYSYNITSTPAYANGMVYYGFAGNFVASDTLGQAQWKLSSGFEIYNQSPIVKNNVVFFAYGSERGITAYDASSRPNQLWSYHENTGDGTFDSYDASDIEVVDNSVFINSKHLYCINASSGFLKWKYANGGIVTPVRLNNKLYAVSNQHSLFALDLYTGQLLWEKTDPSLFISPYGLNAADGKLFYTDASGISALDTIKGSVIWHQAVASDNILHQGYSPIVTGDTGYFRTASSIHLYNIQTGNSLWQVPGLITSNMTVYDNIIYYGATENGKNYLYAMDVRTRTLKWRSTYSSDFPFKISAPCVVTKSGKSYRFGKVFTP